MSERENLKRKARWIIGVVAVCIVLYAGAQNLDDVGRAVSWLVGLILPLLLGLVIALILDVPLRSLERHFFPRSQRPLVKKLRRPCCILAALLVILGVIAGVMVLVVPELVNAVTVLGNSIMETVNSLQQWGQDNALSDTALGQALLSIELNWDRIQDTAINWLGGGVADILGTTATVIGTVASRVISFVLALFFGIYILGSKENLKRQTVWLVQVWLPEQASRVVLHVVHVFIGYFRRFVVGQTVEAIILGSLCALGMWILRIPYAPMVGALVGVTALIPMLGGLLGGIVGALMILPESFGKMLLFLVFLIILQQLEEKLIYPRVVGSSMGLPALWVLGAITVGGSLGGVAGMLFSVPVASALRQLLREATQWKEQRNAEKKKQASQTE